MKLFLIVLIFTNSILYANANCNTGFACSINNLKEEENIIYQTFLDKIKSHFDKDINEDSFFIKEPSLISYNDLFIHKKFV